MPQEHSVKVVEIGRVTHDVRALVVEKPDGYEFTPGQATGVAIARDGWRDEDRPFTFTSLNRDPFLEFTIKCYPERDGVTDRIADLEAGDELLIGDPWGAIRYQGFGTFIAGGAGITPFIAILRYLHAENGLRGNRLIFANQREEDIILAGELRRMLGDAAKFTLSEPSGHPDRLTGRVDRDFLERHVDSFDQHFYVCGPPAMVESVTGHLRDLGAADDRIVTESA